LRKLAVNEKQTTEIEGFEEESLVNLGNYPIDSVLIRSETRTIYEIVRRINQGQFKLAPDFQRDFIWNEEKQSKLIESCLMRIPLPVFYLAESEEGKTIVVDGQQRLTTFSRYLGNQFSLRGLTGDSEQLNDKKFDDLPPKLQNRLEDTQLILYLIDSKVPEGAKLDIFERVNSGVPLTRQQMRNALYSGQATEWLKEQAQFPLFKDMTNFSEKDLKEMRDREFVNRFCAFHLLGAKEYPGDNQMDKFLAESLKKMNKMTPEELAELANRFQTSMKNNQRIFGKHAFRKHPQDTKKNPLNVAIFDVFSVYLARYSEQETSEKTSQIEEAFRRLMEEDDFYKAISGGTSLKRSIVNKFTAAEKIFAEVVT